MSRQTRSWVRSVGAITTVAAVFVAMPLMAPAPPGPTIIYVDAANCPGPGDGSMENPYCSIQTAINNAMDTDEIIVAPGTYFERIILNGRALWLHSSDGAEVTTIDAQRTGTVVTCIFDEGPDTVLEGFTITGGLAEYGGGMRNSGSSLTVINCTFSRNSATSHGGGMRNENFANPTILSCTFMANTAGGGGGMSNSAGSCPSLINCIFSGNEGGGILNTFNFVGSNPTLINCTLRGNTAAVGGGMYSYFGCTAMLSNCVLWENGPDSLGGAGIPIVRFSAVQGGFAGVGNIDADPMFVDPVNGDLHLLPGSPCIDAADNTAIPFKTTDLDGNSRLVDDRATRDTGVPFGWLGPIVDMGAYEYQGR